MAKVKRIRLSQTPKRTTAIANRRAQDSLRNMLSGMGTSRDKAVANTFVLNLLNPQQLEMSYRGDWIARKIVDIPAYDATREWREWQADRADITLIEDIEKEFSVQKKTKSALTKARLYGGSVLIIGTDDGDMAEELNLDRIKKDSLKFLHVASKLDVSPGQLETDVMSPFWGEPTYYEVGGTPGASGVVRFHPSRVIRFLGADRPDEIRATDGWGDPTLQIVYDAITAAASVSQGVAQLIQEAKVDVIKVPNLNKTMANKEHAQRMKDRFGLAADAKSIYNMLLLDGAEEWERISTAFAHLPELLQMYFLIASGAADIPATRMLGQSPVGMNATGESDIRNYYDRIKTEQNITIAPAMERLDEVLVRSSLGAMPGDIFYEWGSLWQMDDKQKGEVAKSKADTFKVDHDSGLIPDEVMRKARLNQLVEDGTYPGLDQIVEEFEEKNGPIDEIEEEEAPMPMPPDPNAPPPDPNNPVPPDRQAPQSTNDRRLLDRAARAGRHYRGKRMTKDAYVRSLYVHRKLLNARDLLKWAAEQGFSNPMEASQLHVTVMYSRKPVDWTKIEETWNEEPDGSLRVKPGGMRVVTKLGNAVVLQFTSSALSWRHEVFKYNGASWDYPEYQPHITITWDLNAVPEDLDEIEPYKGELLFGPEEFEEVDDNFKAGLKKGV